MIITDEITTLTGHGALRFVEELFAEQSLAPPPIAAEWVPELRVISELAVGTRDLPEDASLYDLETFVDVSPDPEHELFAGFGGRGFASWAAHFYHVKRSLRIWIQRHWGSPFISAEDAAEDIAESFALAAKLIAEVEGARAAGRFPRNQSLIVVESDFIQSRWGWSEDGATSWQRDRRALAAALQAVQEMKA